MGNKDHLSTIQKISLQQLRHEAESISALAQQANVSRQAVSRLLDRTSIAPKSRRPKSSTGPRLLPVQRQVIAELVRLTKFQRKDLLPLIHRVFPVFSGLSETGQRRIWDEVWGKDRTYSVECDFKHKTNPYCHVSAFRITGCLIASRKQPENVQLLLLGCEVTSGAIVYRFIKNNIAEISQFAVDLIRHWPLSISELTFVTSADGGFPSVKFSASRDNTSQRQPILPLGMAKRKAIGLHIYSSTEIERHITAAIERIKQTQIRLARYDGEKFPLPSVRFDPSASCSDLILIHHRGNLSPKSAITRTVRKFIHAYNNAKPAGELTQGFPNKGHFNRASPSERLIIKWRSYRYDGGNNAGNAHWENAEALRGLLEIALPKD